MTKAKAPLAAPQETAPNIPFEDRLQRLQVIVTLLENGAASLEESVALYKEGLSHAAACRDLLAKARHDVQICVDGACVPFAVQEENQDEQP